MGFQARRESSKSPLPGRSERLRLTLPPRPPDNLVGVGEQSVHRGAGCRRPPKADVLLDRLMQRLRPRLVAGFARDENEEMIERRFDQHAQRHQQVVARGAQDSQVKTRVGAGALRQRRRLAHLPAGLADLGRCGQICH
jgi:hypothetical protein